MLELFNNPGFLAAGSAVVSAPVIIHLINRMRFRRLHWAAMEFLLKAQKRNRRRLIIEQLLLLALRCLLIMLAVLMVSRFTGCTRSYFMQEGLHIVVLDDTLSMTDQWKEGGQDKNSFKVAKEDVILNNIVKKVAQSTTNERLVILTLSELAKSAAGPGSSEDVKSVVYQKLAERATEDAIKEALDKMQPTKLHTDLTIGLEAASVLIQQNEGKRPVVHIVSDFRLSDWSGDAGEKLKKSLEKLGKLKAELRLWDAAHPVRLEDQGGVPPSHDNVAIVDFKANSRLVGKRMPVTFSVTIANNSPNDKSVNPIIYRFETRINGAGKEELHVKEQLDLNFVPPMPFKVPANSTAVATFKYTPENVKENVDFYSEKFAIHLETPTRATLDDDGLLWDNIRFASVQIRNKIPILIIDGEGSGSDATTYVETAIKSISDSYDIFYGDLVANNPDSTEVLKTGKLSEYAAIYLLNVEKLTEQKKDKEDDTKLKNLENYVKEGGSVTFFLGPKVSGKYYTDKLYRKGAGLFPAPLSENPTYNADVDPTGPLAAKNLTFGSQLLLRDDKTALEDIPIFGKMIVHKSQTERLKLLNVIRHFTVPRTEWGQSQAVELATLPNKKTTLEAGLDTGVARVLDKLDVVLKGNAEYKKYEPLLKPYVQQVRDIILSAQAYQVGQVLDAMLTDKADPAKPDAPNPAQFWTQKDPKVGELRKEIKDIVEQSVFGDPFVVARQFGKGRVVAVMTTAGSGWNDWGYGLARDLWPLFQKYSLNYLFDQTAESSLLVGTPYAIEVKTQKYLQQGAKQLKVIRNFYEAKVNQQVKLKEGKEDGTIKDGIQTFPFTNNYEDGFYVSQLFTDVNDKKPLETWEHIFNVDTKAEGKLQRVSQEEAKYNVLGKDYKDAKIRGGLDPNAGEDLINKQNDLADSPWFFLIFLIVLVCEQALAVHLSYHLRSGEGQLPAEAATSQLRAA